MECHEQKVDYFFPKAPVVRVFIAEVRKGLQIGGPMTLNQESTVSFRDRSVRLEPLATLLKTIARRGLQEYLYLDKLALWLTIVLYPGRHLGLIDYRHVCV